MSDDLLRLKQELTSEPLIGAAWLFGSLAAGTAGSGSDADVAVWSLRELSVEDRIRLVERCFRAVLRPIDLIDLRTSWGPILREALIRGKLLFATAPEYVADANLRMLDYETDFAPAWRYGDLEAQAQWLKTA